MKQNLQDPIKDVFKIAQYVFYIGFLIARGLFFVMQYFEFFGFFYETCSLIVLFFVNTFEWINTACWFLFIAQIFRLRKKRENGKYPIKGIRSMEIIILSAFIFITLGLTIIIFYVNIISITHKCSSGIEDVLEEDIGYYGREVIYKEWVQIIYDYLVFSGFVQLGLRLVLGAALLFLMKKYMSYYYAKRKLLILLSTILILIFLGFKNFMNYLLKQNSFEDIMNQRDIQLGDK